MEYIQDTLFGKMSQEPSHQIMGTTFKPCLKKSQKPIFQCLNLDDGPKPEWSEAAEWESDGEHSTPNTEESPSIEKESFLSQIIKMGGVESKYYLSQKACLGILRRAKKQKKILPKALEETLKLQANITIYREA